MNREKQLQTNLVDVMKSLARCNRPDKSDLLIRKREILNELAAIELNKEG